jgi:hypothetical protein
MHRRNRSRSRFRPRHRSEPGADGSPTADKRVPIAAGMFIGVGVGIGIGIGGQKIGFGARRFRRKGNATRKALLDRMRNTGNAFADAHPRYT